VNKVSFLTALSKVCLGTAILGELRRQSWGRTIFHLFLMSALIGFLIGLGMSLQFKEECAPLIAKLQKEFGSLVIINHRINPELRPDEARQLLLGKGILLNYLPEWKNIAVTPAETETMEHIILWTPEAIATGMAMDKNWIFNFFRIGGAGSFVVTDAAGMNQALNNIKFAPATEIKDLELRKVMFGDLFAALQMVYWFAFWLLYGIGAFCLSLMYTALFTAVFMITGRDRLRTMTLNEFWRMGIYAGYPAMIIGMFFPALDLPFLSYSTVYMLGLIIYWMVAATRLEGQNGSNES